MEQGGEMDGEGGGVERQLTALYQKYAPGELSRIPRLMKMNRGRESMLLFNTKEKFKRQAGLTREKQKARLSASASAKRESLSVQAGDAATAATGGTGGTAGTGGTGGGSTSAISRQSASTGGGRSKGGSKGGAGAGAGAGDDMASIGSVGSMGTVATAKSGGSRRK